MRKLLEIEAARLAAELMPRQLPMFEAVPVEHSNHSLSLFRSHATPKLAFFVSFYGSEKRDSFTVELAWSEHDRWPKDLTGDIPRDWPELGIKKSVIKNGECRFRLPKLWVIPRKDPWWDVVPRPTLEEILNRSRNPHDLSYLEEVPILVATLKLNSLVTDAVEKCREYGLPYFSEIARERNATWPDAP